MFVVVLLLFLVGCATEPVLVDSPEAVEDSSEIQEKEGVKFIVPPEDIQRGIAKPGDIRDAIPSIDEPKYITVERADRWIDDDELVLALQYEGVKRVYPLQILVFHEIVNDVVAGDPVLVTYCPLCGSGIAYERLIEVDGKRVEVEFGTSGKLYNSNLVMYDRKTNTYWQQIDGKAIVGDLVGQELVEISIDTVVWRDWKKVHPDSEVLSKETGFARSYGEDPYGGYYENDFVWFPLENEDSRVHPKTVVFGVEVDGVFKAYRESDLIQKGKVEDTVNGKKVVVRRDEAGVVIVMVDGEEVVKERDFWFAWYAFHPETGLYGVEG